MKIQHTLQTLSLICCREVLGSSKFPCIQHLWFLMSEFWTMFWYFRHLWTMFSIHKHETRSHWETTQQGFFHHLPVQFIAFCSVFCCCLQFGFIFLFILSILSPYCCSIYILKCFIQSDSGNVSIIYSNDYTILPYIHTLKHAIPSSSSTV